MAQQQPQNTPDFGRHGGNNGDSDTGGANNPAASSHVLPAPTLSAHQPAAQGHVETPGSVHQPAAPMEQVLVGSDGLPLPTRPARQQIVFKENYQVETECTFVRTERLLTGHKLVSQIQN